MKRLKHLPFSVDYWSYQDGSKLVYFLTHFHSDHFYGINSSWDNGVIYCTNITKKLLLHKFPGLNDNLIEPLKLNKTYQIPILTKGQQNDKLEEKELIKVTLLPAVHCAGACMYFFQGSFGNILHTGDFRYTQSVHSSPSFLQIFQNNPIDSLYLDTSYTSKRHLFPTREEALRRIIHILKMIYSKDISISIALDTIGKEEILIEIANTFQTKVYFEITITYLSLILIYNYKIDCGE